MKIPEDGRPFSSQLAVGEDKAKEYDICSDCWKPLAQKLRGKGRAIDRGTVFLPLPRVLKEREDDEPEPLPGEPKNIWHG